MLRRKNNNGITLIALIITIIILLILAGITIITLTGEQGILKKANTAEEETLIKKYEELLKVIWQETKLENSEISKEELMKEGKNNIKQDYNFEEASVELEIADLLIEVITKEGYIFQIVEDTIEYIGNKKDALKDIEVTLEASKIQNKKVSFTAKAKQVGGRKIEYICYVNGQEKTRKVTYSTSFTYEQETSFNERITSYVEIKYDEEKISHSNEQTIYDYTITTAEEIKKFRDKINEGNNYKGETIELQENIDLAGTESNQWTPIGNASKYFEGTLEGNHHTVENLYINVRGKENQALFGVNHGTIQNLKVTGNIQGNEGGIALVCGYNYGTIKNVTTNGSVGGWSRVGGCVGENDGTIEFCTNKAKVYPLGTTGYYGRSIGGIVGFAKGKIENCINEGEISGNHGTGGMIGEGNRLEMNNCINRGTVIGLSADTKYNSIYVGGIVGATAYDTKCTTINCKNFGEVKSAYGGSYCGGIAGYIAGSRSGHAIIENCYNLGTLSGSTIAGIVAKEGYSSSAIGTRELRNNYYLDTCGANYGRPGNNVNAEPKTKEEIMAMVEISF